MNNLSSYCELVDAKIRASDKDLPVTKDYIVYRIAPFLMRQLVYNQKRRLDERKAW